MYCNNCGQFNDEGSNFCKKCGRPLQTADLPATKAPETVNPTPKVIEWEYKDYVKSWDAGSRPYRGEISIVYSRYDMWNDLQKYLLPDLHRWIDEGWEPITEVGVGGLEWRSYKKIEFGEDVMGCIFNIFLFFATVSLWLWLWILLKITNPARYEEVVAFRVKMRRPKSAERGSTSKPTVGQATAKQLSSSQENSSLVLSGIPKRNVKVLIRPNGSERFTQPASEPVTIYARSKDGAWVEIYGNGTYWVETSALTIEGNVMSLPVIDS